MAWPRTRLAEIVERLKSAGAASIAFDVMFAEPDRMSLEELVKSMSESTLRNPRAGGRRRRADQRPGLRGGCGERALWCSGVILTPRGEGPRCPSVSAWRWRATTPCPS